MGDIDEQRRAAGAKVKAGAQKRKERDEKILSNKEREAARVEDDKKARTCDCAEKMDEALKPYNGMLVGSLRLNNAPRRVYIMVEKRDDMSRTKPPRVAASYCPFCGVKQP